MSISRTQITSMFIPVLTALISIPVADGVYRMAGARPSENLAGLFTSFGDGGYRLRSNVATSTDWYSGTFTVFTDDLGLRCGSEDDTRTQANSTIDYLFLGDSQGFGQALSYSATVVGGFAALADRQGQEVANCSVGGHYLRNQLEIAKWLHDENSIEIQHVVLLLSPYLIATAQSYNRAQVTADGTLTSGGKRSLANRIVNWARNNTVIFIRIRNMVRNVMGVKQDNNVLIDFFRPGERNDKITLEFRETLREMLDWAQSIDATLEVVYTPFTGEVDFTIVEAIAEQQNIIVDSNVPYFQAAEVTKSLAIPLFDLRPVLAEVKAAGMPLTCRGDPHYSEETSRACAKFIWDSLKQE